MDKFERPSWDEYFMLQAELAKLRSNCVVRKVGAVIVKENRQLATGYNGTPPGVKNCYEGGCKRCQDRINNNLKQGESLDRCVCSHAESNAIMHCAILGIGIGSKNLTLYSTLSPCLECTKMAITVGVKRIVCIDSYSETNTSLLSDSSIAIDVIPYDKITRWADLISNDSQEQ